MIYKAKKKEKNQKKLKNIFIKKIINIYIRMEPITLDYSSLNIIVNNLSIQNDNNEELYKIINLDDTYKKMEEVEGLKINLFSHQKTLLYRCMQLELYKKILLKNDEKSFINTNVGLICDKVGSGKSLVVLSLILKNKILELEKRDMIISSSGQSGLPTYIRVISNKKEELKTNLIVVPPTIINQWEEYIQKYTNLTYYSIKLEKDINKYQGNINFFENYDIILISGKRYNSFVSIINYEESKNKKIYFSRIIMDEVDTLNIPNCKELNANFYWFITATYQNVIKYYMIKNNGFIKNTFVSLYTVQKKYKNPLLLKNDNDYIDNSIKLPDYKLKILRSKNTHIINILQNIVSKEVINCLNANDIDLAIEKINCNVTDENNMINIICQDLNKKKNNIVIKLNTLEMMEYDSEQMKNYKREKLIKKLEIVENKIKLIYDRLKNNNICPICIEEPKNKVITNCCKNIFCLECILNYLNYKKCNECPLCRSKQINPKDLTVIKKDLSNVKIKIKENSLDELKDKYDHLRNIIEENKGKKILFYTEYTSDNLFSKIEKIFIKNEDRYDKVIGSIHKIKNTLNDYKDGDLNILLLDAKTCGSGLNLENTDIIILFHAMNKEMEQQIIGRAQRLGRKNELIVYKILYESELI